MNFYCNSGGTIFHVDPERIFQGSAGVNTIRFIGRFPSSAQVLLAYKLPNGNLTSPKVLTLVDELAEVEAPDNGGKFSVWETVLGAVPRLDSNGRVLKDDNGNVVYDLDFTITENYGTATLQFFVYAASNSITVNGQVYNVKGGLLATASSNFTIEKGAPALIPTVEELTSTDAQVLLAEILNIISSNQTAYNNFTQEVTDKITAIEGSVNTALEEVAQVVENDKAQDAEIAKIRELVENAEQVAKGVQLAVSYADYSAMITALNALSANSYDIGQSIYIATLNVPDLWVYAIEATAVPYTYTSDEDFINSLLENGFVQVGNYKLSALETGKVAIGDYVLLSKFSAEMGERFLKGEGAPATATVAPFVGALYLDTTNNNTYQCTAIDEATPSYTWVKLIRETDIMTNKKVGVAGLYEGAYGGIAIKDGKLCLIGTAYGGFLSDAFFKNPQNYGVPVLSRDLYRWLKVGLVQNNETWTDEDKTKACETIGAVNQREVTEAMHARTIPKRTATGTINTNDPRWGNEAANKRYVDNLPDNVNLSDEQKAKWQKFIGSNAVQVLTQAEYDALETKEENVVYIISDSPDELEAIQTTLANILDGVTAVPKAKLLELGDEFETSGYTEENVGLRTTFGNEKTGLYQFRLYREGVIYDLGTLYFDGTYNHKLLGSLSTAADSGSTVPYGFFLEAIPNGSTYYVYVKESGLANTDWITSTTKIRYRKIGV